MKVDRELRPDLVLSSTRSRDTHRLDKRQRLLASEFDHQLLIDLYSKENKRRR
jgi:hypothetical protein